MRDAITLLLLFSLWQALYGDQQKKITITDSGYTYTFIFTSSLPKEAILHYLFDSVQLQNHSNKTSSSRIIHDYGDYHDVELYLRYLVYSSRSTYRRTMLADSGVVKIEMLQFNHNSTFLPRVKRSYAEYRLIENRESVTVRYIQNVSFDKPVNWFYMKILESKLHEFADTMVEYFEKLEIK